MKFDPAVHTTLYLCSHPEVALRFAEKSAEFAQHPVAQDGEVLRIGLETNTVAHTLAKHSELWALTDAAQRPDILFLLNKYGFSVAHFLSNCQPMWALTPAAQNYDILSFIDNSAFSVAFNLAFKHEAWCGTPAAQAFDVLSITHRRLSSLKVAHTLAQHQPSWSLTAAAQDPATLALKNERGITVAHQLAIYQPSWLDSEAASNLDVINMVSAEQGSVAQTILSNHPKKYEYLAKLINRGYSYKTPELSDENKLKHIPTQTDVKLFIQMTTQDIENEFDVAAAFRKLILFYSTLKNLERDVKAAGTIKVMTKSIAYAEKRFRDLLQVHPALFDDPSTSCGIHSEPAMNFIKQICSEKYFSLELSIEKLGDNVVEPDNNLY
jgi:hypothetical protein